MIVALRPNLLSAQCQLRDGDIICCQHREPENLDHEATHNWTNIRYSNPVEYYKVLQDRVVIEFRPELGDNEQMVFRQERGESHPTFTLTFGPRRYEYNLQFRVAKILNDTAKLQFTTTYLNGDNTTTVLTALFKNGLVVFNPDMAKVMASNAARYSTKPVMVYQKILSSSRSI
ncbi:hypothetical protein C8J57DRAFT_1333400 [Mycena rebaudengoi]|nr:hypothetical protein C8J57DRAFT_1333400 [Mycena rebaudengoi]